MENTTLEVLQALLAIEKATLKAQQEYVANNPSIFDIWPDPTVTKARIKEIENQIQGKPYNHGS